MQCPTYFALTAVCCLATACAGDSRSSTPRIPIPSATAGTGSAAVGAGSAGNFGPTSNPNNPLVQLGPAAGSGGAMAPATMGTGSSRDPVLIDQCMAVNPAGLSDADAKKLQAGGTGGAALKWLYPYDGTVFPRGMLAPLLMWNGGAADAVYVHIKSKAFEYKACLKPTAAGQLQLTQDVWDKAGQQTYGKADLYLLELSVLAAGSVSGPIALHFNIAQATIKGSIYYNSYNSKLGNGMGGMVLRIPAGGTAAAFISTGCNGCHSVSADGSRMVSQFVPGMGDSFQLMSGGAANPPAASAGPRAGFGAFYPDGSKYLATSAVIDVARTFMTQGFGAPADATLYDASTGQPVTNTGIPTGALMPMFSPDGTRLAFNDYAIGMAQGLAIMSYDVKTNTASGYKMLMKESGAMRPGWPFVLPDNGAVVFVRTDGADFSGNGAGITAAGGLGGGLPPIGGGTAPFSELSIVDAASGTVTLLAKAMGYNSPADAAANTTYLPFGAEELHHDYFPTVSPVAAGGYFWVFFDSLRHYGNLGQQRQLWGSALDIQPDGTYKADLSHPAFYLPGQEFGTGNHRAFAALDPCRKDGDKCTSGIDCCGGFCYIDKPAAEFGIEPVGSCTPKMNSCAKRDERCTSDADCCPPAAGEPTNSCIAGFCAFIAPLN
jgi:hypothetical protein